jgi:hypothetical protein
VKKQFSDGIRVYTYANNHYAGNGLQTIDLFWKSAGVIQGIILIPSSTAYPNAESPMTEERKFAILFAATLMCARKLMEIDDKPSPVRIMTVDKAIRNAAYILGEIDKKWPSEAPAGFVK